MLIFHTPFSYRHNTTALHKFERLSDRVFSTARGSRGKKKEDLINSLFNSWHANSSISTSPHPPTSLSNSWENLIFRMNILIQLCNLWLANLWLQSTLGIWEIFSNFPAWSFLLKFKDEISRLVLESQRNLMQRAVNLQHHLQMLSSRWWCNILAKNNSYLCCPHFISLCAMGREMFYWTWKDFGRISFENGKSFAIFDIGRSNFLYNFNFV